LVPYPVVPIVPTGWGSTMRPGELYGSEPIFVFTR
jgi:hypothetical protein